MLARALTTLLLAIPPLPQGNTPQQKDLGALPLEAGRRALKEGKRDEAVHHLTAALEFAPDRLEVMALLLDACSDAPDARSLWADAWATASAPAGGSIAVDSKMKALLPEEPGPLALAAARSAAVEELVKLARDREHEVPSKPDLALVVRWLKRMAIDLCRDSPALAAAYAYDLTPRLKLPPDHVTKVAKALETFGSNELGSTRTDHALRAGRILAGLAQQLGWDKDLQGPKPAGLGSLKASAGALLGTARRELSAKFEKPWTIDELLGLDGDQAEAFTRAHSTFATPGVAFSTQSWYRIETDCGFETLLGAAQTIELHHKRLAGFFGQDPFVGRQGICRIVPEASGLESEGAPFWWAAGFQGGDTTTVRFSCGTIEGLGHLLTHELTHRFDGAIYPGIPSWLAEGKAVWTGGAYGRAEDEKFVEGWASIGTIEAAFLKGYGDLGKLTKLISGTLDDYRDNYTAGFALYVYLHTRKPQGTMAVFADRLMKFMKEARTKHGKEHFEECFCDGKEGRPQKLEGFMKDWAPWLAGFYWQNREKSPWTKEYEVPIKGGDSKTVYDEPTWVWSRNRAEPRFGQDQFALAGRLWMECGDRRHAIDAFLAALMIDGRRPEDEALLCDALTKENRPDAAWCVKAELEFPYGARVGAAPFLGSLPKTRAFVELLRQSAAEALASERPATAAARRADGERLASWLGLDRSPPQLEVDVSKLRHPFDPQPRPLAMAGWGESGLTGYEERRVKGLWYQDDDGILHVGRKKPRDATGTIDRGAAQVDAFALAPDWILPGTWRLDAHVQFTTSFIAGAVVFGYSEREENLRFGFNAGDFMYAIGVSNKEPEFKEMGWGVTGLRDRDGGLPGSTCGGGFPFGGPAGGFDFSIEVDGAYADFSINGKRVGSYHTVDGAPIEGQIGFASGMGAYDVRHARVTRLDRSRLAPRKGFPPTGLDLVSTRTLAPWNAQNKDVSGISHATQGTLLLWLSPPEKPFANPEEIDAFVSRLNWDVRELASLVEKTGATQRLVVAAPQAIGEPARAKLGAYAKKLLGDDVTVMLHVVSDVSEQFNPPLSHRILVFVDSAGIERVWNEFPTAELILINKDGDNGIVRWMKVFREHGQPPRKLPEVTRDPKPPKGKEGTGGG